MLTYRYRIKDASRSTLRAQARSVNHLWNYCCQIDREADRRWKAGMSVRHPTAFDRASLCRGVTKDLGIHSDTVDAVCCKFADERNAVFPKTPRLRSFKKNLDFVPFSNFKRPAKLIGSLLTVLGRRHHLCLSRPLPDNGAPKSWEFSTDSRGRWYVNVHVEMPEAERRQGSSVGIGRRSEAQLALFHRRGQTARARALAAKVANQRKQFRHVVSAKIVRDHAEIYIGDVSPSQLAKTRMAKSIHDAGWAMLRNVQSYKSIATGGVMRIVSERWTSQTCSCCGSIPGSSPKGMGAFGIRHWVCSDCGEGYDRDLNAARNILRVGLERQPPGAEIPAL